MIGLQHKYISLGVIMITSLSNNSREATNRITGELMDIFVKVHSKLGPGLLESVYEEILCHELSKRNFSFVRQVGIPVIYDDKKMDLGFRADIIVENLVIIEIKSIENLAPVHHKQLLTYLKLTDKKVGLLVNFNVNLIKEGVIRIVNNF